MHQARSEIHESIMVNAVHELLRMPAVVQRTGLGRSTIYRLMASNQFPLPVRLARRAVGWRIADLVRWSESLPTATH